MSDTPVPVEQQIPMIWTAKGNLPIASLTYRPRWEDTEDYVKFVEQYLLGEEVVKVSAHVLTKKPIDFAGAQASLAG